MHSSRELVKPSVPGMHCPVSSVDPDVSARDVEMGIGADCACLSGADASQW